MTPTPDHHKTLENMIRAAIEFYEKNTSMVVTGINVLRNDPVSEVKFQVGVVVEMRTA